MPSFIHILRHLLRGLLWLAGIGAGVSLAQDVSAPLNALPSLLSSPRPHREAVLTPVPESFDWIDRDVPPNPRLEAFLARHAPSHNLQFSISLSEEFSDNTDQEDEDAETEFETSIELDTVYRVQWPSSFISLANSLEADYEAKQKEADIGFVNFALQAGYRFLRLSLALSESLVRDNDLEVASASGIRVNQNNFLRNQVTPQIRYTLSRRTGLHLAYTNTIVIEEGDADEDDEDEDRENSISHAITARIRHRLSQTLEGNLSYTFFTDREDSDDTYEHRMAARVGYRFSPNVQLSFRTFGILTERDRREMDAERYGAAVGMTYQLGPDLGLFAEVGATRFGRDDNGQETRANWQIGLDGEWEISPRATLEFTSNQRITNTADEVEDVGLVLRQSFDLEFNYELTSALEIELFATYIRTDFLEERGRTTADQDREDVFWRAGTELSYEISENWSVSLEYRHRQRDSNDDANDFKENQVTFTLSSDFSVF
ncbi:MAG: outer membrane beta-barrel protein [Candidatus Tectomicrobia bacterium]|nr:outer membrane beta-barrel protein [Candidatus Tectomicrobia bacterium]